MQKLTYQISLILLTLIFTTNTSFSQSDLSNKIDAFFEKAKKLRHPDSLENYGRKILEIKTSNKDEHIKATIHAYQIIGYASYLRGNYPLSIKQYDSALVYKNTGIKDNLNAIIFTLRNRATSNIRAGNKEIAKSQFLELVEICKNYKDFKNLASIYSSLGILEKDASNFNGAISYYNKAIKLLDSIGNEGNKTTVFLNIGIAQAKLGDLQQSNKSFHKALNIAKKHNGLRDEYRAYNNLSVNFNSIKEYDSAIYYIRKIIPFYKKRKNKRSEFLAYQNLGRNLLYQNNIDSAEWYFKKSLKGFNSIKNPNGVLKSYFNLAELAFKKQDYKKTIQFSDSSISYANKLKNKISLKNTYNLLGKTYEATNDYKQAVKFFHLEKEIIDNNFRIENAKSLNEILVKQHVKEQKKAINNLSQQNSIYKSTLFKALVSLILLGTLLFLVIRRNRSIKKEVNLLQDKLDSIKKDEDTGLNELYKLKSKAVINLNMLKYIKSDGHYVEFYLHDKNKPEIDRNTITNILQTLPQSHFVRIHKSYVININYLKIINSTKLMLKDGTWLNLSRTYKQDLKSILNKK